MTANENMLDKYYCNACDYRCCKKSSWTQHVSTAKHNKAKHGLTQANEKYACHECGITFKHQSSYCRHKKKCAINKNIPQATDYILDKDLIITLIKQNSELMNILSNNNAKNSNNTTNSHNTNSNNKTFNLNFFLNETCKNAMNISDFVSSIKVTLEDLEYTGRQGYIQGISNIILNNLQKLEQHERPLHCNDLKREILYIKENNRWEKETMQKPILTKVIKTIANENIKQIKHWRDKYPDCTDAESKKNNMYLKIVSNSMNGLTEEESNKNIDKIISNVAKEVIIDKE
jgi:hypothetical protein